jgi:hypothetical protein
MASAVADLNAYIAKFERLRQFVGGEAILMLDEPAPDVKEFLLSADDQVLFATARDSLAKDIQAATGQNFIQQAQTGLRPELESDNLNELITKSRALVAEWQRSRPVARRNGLGIALGLGALGVAAVWIKKRSD